MAHPPRQKPGAPPSNAPTTGDLGRLVARAPAMVAAVNEAYIAAASRLPTILLGETGTGKSVLAERIHTWSGRSGAFVEVNCAILGGSLAESELFGHEKGAFTGADRPRDGRFKEANRGTLFLDEVGELPLEVQAKLLIAVERGLFRPVGARRDERADVLVIVATNRDILAMVAAGTFREDLYHRLCGSVITLPPLRERTEELGELLAGIFAQHPREDGAPWSLGEGVLPVLQALRWPGNVRELARLGARLMARASGPVITILDVQGQLTPREAPPSPRAWVLQRLAVEPLGRAALFEGFTASLGTLKRAIDALVESADVEREGSGRATRYRLAGEESLVPPMGPTPLVEVARRWLSRRGWVRSGQLADELGVSPSTSKRLLAGLKADGLIETRGRGRGAKVRWVGDVVAEARESEARCDPTLQLELVDAIEDDGALEPRSEVGGHRVPRKGRRPRSLAELPERDRAALQIAARDGRVTRKALTGLGVPERSGSRLFKRLVGDGLILPQGGRGWATGYAITPAGQGLVEAVSESAQAMPNHSAALATLALTPPLRPRPVSASRHLDDSLSAQRAGAAISLAARQGRLLVEVLALVIGPEAARRTVVLLVATGLLVEIGPDEYALLGPARPSPDEM